MDYLQQLISDIETHSVEGIRECFSKGINPNDLFRGEPLIYELTSEYTRTSRFKDCIEAFAEAGLVMEDKVLLAVLMDDAATLKIMLDNEPEALQQKYTLRCAYTPIQNATLLHICAEFNHLSCAEALVARGADINARAGLDKHGFGNQTPIFHTVNQNSDNSAAMMEYLLNQGADLHHTVPGLIWGKGYEWETLIPAVNPISYAMMGLLPQMHRKEERISEIVSLLLKKGYGIDYSPVNVPNAYLHK